MHANPRARERASPRMAKRRVAHAARSRMGGAGPPRFRPRRRGRHLAEGDGARAGARVDPAASSSASQLESGARPARERHSRLVEPELTGAVVERRLDMHVPSDSQLVILQRPDARAVSDFARAVHARARLARALRAGARRARGAGAAVPAEPWAQKARAAALRVGHAAGAARQRSSTSAVLPLAQSREMLRLSVAPRELGDRAIRRARRSRSWACASPLVTRATDARRAWVDIPGRTPPARAASLASMRGVYTRPTVDRVYTPREATRRLIGRVDDTGTPRGRSRDGARLVAARHRWPLRLARDAARTRFDSPADSDVVPEAGDAVVLTINQALQDIADRAWPTRSRRRARPAATS